MNILEAFDFKNQKSGKLMPLLVGLILLCATPSFAQTTTIGYDPITAASGSDLSFTSFDSSSVYVIPFYFNVGYDYSVSSMQLLLSGDANLSDFDISISLNEPDSLTLPAALTTFSTTGTLTATLAVFTFDPNTAPSLTSGDTYYLNLAYTGSDTANWIVSTYSDGGENTGSGVTASVINSQIDPGIPVLYRLVNGGGYSDDSGRVGGVTLTATPAPEPGVLTLMSVGLVFPAALFYRRLRRFRA